MQLLSTLGYLILMLFVVAVIVKIPFFIFQVFYWALIKRYFHWVLDIYSIVLSNLIIRSLVFAVFFTSGSVFSSNPLFIQILNPLLFIIPLCAGVAADVYAYRKKKTAVSVQFLVASIVINVASSCYTQLFIGYAGGSCIKAGGC